jgi:hypothetical protein
VRHGGARDRWDGVKKCLYYDERKGKSGINLYHTIDHIAAATIMNGMKARLSLVEMYGISSWHGCTRAVEHVLQGLNHHGSSAQSLIVWLMHVGL